MESTQQNEMVKNSIWVIRIEKKFLGVGHFQLVA
jgi:hypothetical protein